MNRLLLESMLLEITMNPGKASRISRMAANASSDARGGFLAASAPANAVRVPSPEPANPTLRVPVDVNDPNVAKYAERKRAQAKRFSRLHVKLRSERNKQTRLQVAELKRRAKVQEDI